MYLWYLWYKLGKSLNKKLNSILGCYLICRINNPCKEIIEMEEITENEIGDSKIEEFAEIGEIEEFAEIGEIEEFAEICRNWKICRNWWWLLNKSSILDIHREMEIGIDCFKKII